MSAHAVRWAVEGAYHPMDTGTLAGGGHVVVQDDLHVGRLHRAKGDALCKPRGKFWGLGAHRDKPDCKRCVEIALRLGFLVSCPACGGPDCVCGGRGWLTRDELDSFLRDAEKDKWCEWMAEGRVSR